MPCPDSTRTTLNPGEDDQVKCFGYKRSVLKTFFAHAISILLLGIPYLVGRWKPNWSIRWFYSKCFLKEADIVLIQDLSDDFEIVPIHIVEVDSLFPNAYSGQDPREGNTPVLDTSHLLEDRSQNLVHVFFVYRNTKYVWNFERNNFLRLTQLDKGCNLSQLREFGGFSIGQQQRLQILYGLNSIEVEVKSYPKLLFDEVLNPFYIFQIASMILWSLDRSI